MILMNKMVIDIQGFDESQFGIFDESDIPQLIFIWEELSKRDINMFIKALSPIQKQQLTLWATSRSSYSVNELIIALEKFLKYLKKYYSKHKTYPKIEKKK